ncbi:MAG: YfhO family protein [Clostridia bacterium]|nr:YfhO family protein [Clostridia bacterium]
MRRKNGSPGEEIGISPSPLCKLRWRLIREYRAHPSSYLLFCFALPFFLMMLIYAFMGVWPFGANSVLTLDLNGQYVYFFEALRSFIYGDASLLYSFSRSLGGEFLGIYAYYLASPLSYLVALFPREGMLDALFLLLLLKQGLSGLSFGYYLKKTARLSPVTAVMFSTVYSLTAYSVVMQHNTMWVDNVILLPLVAVGIRALVSEGKYKLYTVSLVLCMMSNYYIGYMTCIFCVLYFFYVHLALTPKEKNPRGLRANFLRSGVRFGFFSLTAGAISMLTVIPAVYALTFGKDTFSSPSYDFVVKQDILDILTKFFFASYDTVRPEGLPNLYCGLITLMLIPFYFISRRVSTREKGANLLLSLFLLFCFSVHVIDLIWHGGQAPNWLNYRYSYMLSFLLVGMAAKGFEDIRSHRARWVIYAATPLSLILILAEHFGYKHMETVFFPVPLNLLCIGIYVIALAFFIMRRDVSRRYASLCLLVLVSLEMMLGGLVNTGQLYMDVGRASRASYYDFLHRWEGATEAAKADTQAPFYRMEKLRYRRVNDPYLFNYRGVSGSTSTLNRDTISFLNVMGYASAYHASCYTGTNPFVDSFLSISYVLGEVGMIYPDSYVEIYNDGDTVAYRNPDALPIAFGVSDDVHTITFLPREYDKDGNRIDPDDNRTIISEGSPFERMNALAKALLGEDVVLFSPVEYRYTGENVYHLSSSRHYSKRNAGQDAYVNFRLSVTEESEIFAYFPTDTYKEAQYYLNGEHIGRHFVWEESGYLCLGSYEAGEECVVTFQLGDEGIYINRNVEYFYSMDRAVYRRLIDTLCAGGYEVETCTEDYFCGKITVSEGFETILTTIPYDAGWRITANGQPVEGYETLDALLSFDLAPGEYTLELEYSPKEYVYAACCFTAGLCVFGGTMIGERMLRRRKTKRTATQP